MSCCQVICWKNNELLSIVFYVLSYIFYQWPDIKNIMRPIASQHLLHYQRSGTKNLINIFLVKQKMKYAIRILKSSYSLSTNKHRDKENCLHVCSTSQVLRFQMIAITLCHRQYDMITFYTLLYIVLFSSGI